MKPTTKTIKSPKANPAEEQEVVVKDKKEARQFTYIGAGEGSPYLINLMGKQKFTRGIMTEVTDPEILAKIGGMSTFVEGPVDPEILHEIDAEGKKKFETRIAEDRIINAKFNKRHAGE